MAGNIISKIDFSRLIMLLRSEIATGIQFTIYDPDLDEDRKIGEVLVRKLIDILQNV